MEGAVKILNEMVQSGVIEQYAIGGATAALFYVEPINTADLDVVVSFSDQKLIVTLDEIFSFLATKGYAQFVDEAILVEGIPVQFLPAADPLMQEALQTAQSMNLASEKARVIGPEFLMAIMVQVGRPKDVIRLEHFLSSYNFDPEKFDGVLQKFGLQTKFEHIKQKYFEGGPTP